MDKSEHNNSPEYWEERFSTRDWDKNHGEAQTRFFGALAARLLPAWAVSDIRHHKRTVADLGCAEGAGTVALAQVLQDCRVMGVDFAASAIARAKTLHPGVEYQVGSLEAPPPEAQVLMLSNVLEHLADPLSVLRGLGQLEQVKYVIVLVPLQEGHRHHEHVVTFDYNNFPIRLGRLSLAAFDEIDLRGTPDERYWYGKQAFAVWAHDDVLASSGPTLQSVMAGAHRAQSRLTSIQESMRRLEQEDRRRLVELTETRRQLAEALVDVRRLESSQPETEPTSSPESIPNGALRFLPDREAAARAAALERELEEVRGTLKWRWSSRLAERLDRAGLGAGLKLVRSLDREGVLGTAQRVKRAVRRRLIARSQLIRYDVDPWVALAGLKPLDVKVVDSSFAGVELPPFSIVTTVRNEEENILDFLRSVAAQKLAPAEVIIVDGGSKDATVALVKEFAHGAPFKVRVIDEGPCNIAAGRNRGLRDVTEEFVVFIDAGCLLRPDFFSAMVGPFAQEAGVDLVGGIYVAAASAPHANDFVPDWQRCDFTTFLPSARAVAVRAPLARAIGGFPEYLTHTGEDTLFDIAYRRVSRAWVVNREAVVEWRGPTTEAASRKLGRSYCKGDGESGVGDRRFYRWLSELQHGTLGRLGSHDEAAFEGFVEGRERRATVEMDRRKLRGVVVMFDASQLTDFGGERRVAQLVTELTRQAVKVVHVSALGPDTAGQRYLDLDQTLLELYHVNDFDPADLARRYGERLLGILVERSHPALVPPVEALRNLVPRAPVVLVEPDQVSATRVSPEERARAAAALAPLARGQVLAHEADAAARPQALVLPDAADLRLYHRSLHELRPKGWPVRWKERVAVVPMPYTVSDADAAFFRSIARANPTVGFVLLTPGWRWPELQKQWGVIERNISGIGWQTPIELAGWVANAAAIVMPWTLDTREREQWAEGWGERAAAVGVPAIVKADHPVGERLHVASPGSFARELLHAIEHPAATAPGAGHTWQQNAHRLVSFLFDVGR